MSTTVRGFNAWNNQKKYDTTVCAICAFQGNGNCELDRCSGTYRSDKKFVIFKKLEKVGEMYKKRVSDGTVSTFQRYRVYNSVILPKEPYIYYNFIDATIEIEIKQNKEDMEDLDKIKVRDYTKVEELNVMEEKKLNLKPFDLEAARSGKPVCTRDGRKARIICFDRRLFYKNVSYPILALVECSDGEDDVCGYNEKGKVLIEDGAEYKDDLMMLPEKRIGWITINKDAGLFKSKEEAERYCTKDYATVRVEFEI